MTQQIQVVKFDKNLSVDENVKNLILYEIQLNKELKQIRKVASIYQEEINEKKQNLHITKDGKVMFIQDMENSHLVNTVKVIMRLGHNLGSRKLKKYMQEIKKRGLVGELLDESSDDGDTPILDNDYYESEFDEDF